MQDFFIGKKNKKIEKKALALGLSLIFLKEVSNKNDLKKIKQEKRLYDGIFIKTSNINIMRQIIDKASNIIKTIIVLGTNDIINRTALEHKKITAILSPEYNRKKDFINYRNSGLNQVLCKIARENKKMIIENFSEINKLEKKEKSLVLGRIIQNARLCKKYKVKFMLRNIAKKEEDLISCHQISNFEKILFP